MTDTRRFPGNTDLHDAIHDNNTELALSCININDLNTSALGNTPLLFALKKANIKVAFALLKQPTINIHAKDNHGLTALHWSCMLRQHDLIDCLLSLGADPHLVVDPAQSFKSEEVLDIDHEISPLALYKRDIVLAHFTNYWSAAKQAPEFAAEYQSNTKLDQRYFSLFYNLSYSPYSRIGGFADRDGLRIPHELAYTDIVFHMREMCINLGWSRPTMEFVTLGNGVNRSHDVFEKNFGMGITEFCKSRNAIPVNEKLIERMLESKANQPTFGQL